MVETGPPNGYKPEPPDLMSSYMLLEPSSAEVRLQQVELSGFATPKIPCNSSQLDRLKGFTVEIEPPNGYDPQLPDLMSSYKLLGPSSSEVRLQRVELRGFLHPNKYHVVKDRPSILAVTHCG